MAKKKIIRWAKIFTLAGETDRVMKFTRNQLDVIKAFGVLGEGDPRSASYAGKFGLKNLAAVTAMTRQKIWGIVDRLSDRGLIGYAQNDLYLLTALGIRCLMEIRKDD